MTQGSPSSGPSPPERHDEADAAEREALNPRVAPAPSGHAPETVQSLRQAMRRVRIDDAERVGVVADLRTAQIGRLELLHEALRPLIAQIPADVDLFDIGLMPGTTPRLFVDMIGFVEMGRDTRLYRLLQDTRHKRITIAESNDIATMVDAITDYVARRLLEREKALAADTTFTDGLAEPAPVETNAPPSAVVATAPVERRKPRPRPVRWIGIAFAFLIDLLGSIAFFTLLAAAGWVLWTRFHGQG